MTPRGVLHGLAVALDAGLEGGDVLLVEVERDLVLAVRAEHGVVGERERPRRARVGDLEEDAGRVTEGLRALAERDLNPHARLAGAKAGAAVGFGLSERLHHASTEEKTPT